MAQAQRGATFQEGQMLKEPQKIEESEESETEQTSRMSPVTMIILASTALATLGVPFISPALPVIRDVFSVTDAEASLLVSAYFVVGIVFSPFIGVLEDRFGRRPVLGSSLIIFGTTGGFLLFASEFWMLLAIRFVQGTAAAGLFISTVTLISDTYDGARRNSVLGLNNAVLSIGAAVFPVLGGLLVAISWNTPFIVYLIAVPLGLIALKFVDEPVKSNNQEQETDIRDMIGALGDRSTLAAYMSAAIVEILLFGTILTALPFYLSRIFELNPVAIGLAVSITSVAAAVIAMTNGQLSKRLSPQQIITLSFLFYGIGMLAFWSATSFLWVLGSAAIFGAGTGLSLPAIDAQISNSVPDELRGKALSIRNSTTFLGRTTGPILFTAIGILIGYPSLLLGAGVLTLATVPFLFALPEII